MNNQPGLYDHGNTSIQRVSPDYFRTLGTRLIKGRYLDERDTADQPGVTLINETFARKYFPDEDPVGKTVIANMTSYFPKLTIVGIVADFKMNALDKPVFPEMFWPVAQWPGRDCWLMLRTKVDPLALAAAARDEIGNFDRDLPVEEMSTMTSVIGDSMWRYRFSALLIGLFSALALVLAAAGIYGVMSYAVSRRTREIGIRLALGAQPRNVLVQVVREGMKLAALGLALGAAVSLVLGRAVASLLFGVTATDPVTFAAVSLLLASVALVACYVPARRAAKVDPMIALR